jgi:3D (Asp-Asp-Asp) domain-containing protein
MRLCLSKAPLALGICLLSFGFFMGSLVSAAPSRPKIAKTKSVKISSRKPPRRSSHLSRHRWDSSLAAHPSRASYRRRLSVRATAYQPIDTPMEGGRWTKTERDGRSVHGVAVDPRIIPLGTRLWIPGYGHAIADDIGSAIKGHRIDLRMQQSANMLRWGVRTVQIYVLK